MFGPSSELLCRTSVASPWGYHCYARTASTAQPVFLAQLDGGINESRIGGNNKGFESYSNAWDQAICIHLYLHSIHLWSFLPSFRSKKLRLFCKQSSGEVSIALDERTVLDLWGITNPAKALTNSGFMQGISSRGFQNVSRFVTAQWFYVLPGARSVHSSVIILHQMPPLKCSTSTGCPHLRLLACSNVLAQDDAQCSTALFEPCSENFLSQDTRCAGK